MLFVSKFAHQLLQKLLVAKNHLSLVAESARCKKSLDTCCKIYPILLAKVAHCKTSFVTRCKIRSLLVAEVPRCKISLLTRSKICLILVEELAHCKKLLVTRYEETPSTNIYLKSTTLGEFYLLNLIYS